MKFDNLVIPSLRDQANEIHDALKTGAKKGVSSRQAGPSKIRGTVSALPGDCQQFSHEVIREQLSLTMTQSPRNRLESLRVGYTRLNHERTGWKVSPGDMSARPPQRFFLKHSTQEELRVESF